LRFQSDTSVYGFSTISRKTGGSFRGLLEKKGRERGTGGERCRKKKGEKRGEHGSYI